MAVNYFLSTVGNDVEAFNNYATFRQATADNTAPIPGYLIKEVNAIALENNGSNCKAIVDYFISRLQSTSPLVKIKVLKLLLNLVQNGHRKVLEELKVHEVALKNAQSFSGSLDNAQDQKFNEKVRSSAKELLTIIFSDETAGEVFDCPPMTGLQSLCGLGSQASTTRLPGFGNTINQKSLGERVSEHVCHVMDKILSPTSDNVHYKNQAKVLSESLPHYNPVSISKSVEQEDCLDAPSDLSAVAYPKRVAVHVAGKAGGGWDDSDDDKDVPDEDSEDILAGFMETSLSTDPVENKVDIPAEVEWQEERDLIGRFAVDQPLERLQHEEIDALCKKSAMLNCEKICELLVETLSSSEKKDVMLRSLVLIEYLLHNDVLNPDSVVNIALPKLLEMAKLPGDSVQVKSMKLSLIVQSLCGQLPNPRFKAIMLENSPV